MRFVIAATAAFFLCAGAASANPVQSTEANPCVASEGRPLPERLIICSETIAAQTTLTTHIDARMSRAKLYGSVRDWRRAIDDYSEVVRRAPKYAPGYAALAEVRAADGNIAGAVTEYGQAIKLEPQNANYFARRCWMRARLGRDFAAAMDDCEHSLALDPGAYYARGAQAFVHLLQRDYPAAIADFDGELAMIASDMGAQAYALYGRGVAKIMAGHGDNGRADLAFAQRIDPTIGDQFRTWGFGP
jgi:tetratricopeptide (TPR) repeat protein